ncbi:hypothetical protein AcW1_002603 [Taiwanofungus camphoratus]|nr:hypothetical protein AcV5_009716 [Antrodia cinnamomea]KAI0943445.1 hypothetical protein AcW1_002603 [Antrodia cinnamomea]
MSSKGNPNTPPKYLNDFSKALASEVRILLNEVGKLRDERRALQLYVVYSLSPPYPLSCLQPYPDRDRTHIAVHSEIAELMAVKSKHGAGGEYTPDWRPKPEEPPRPPSPGPPPPPSSVLGDGPARPAWRTVHKRENRQKAKAKALPPPDAPPPALHAPPPNLPAWAQWKPNPLLSPQPHIATAAAPLPEHVAPSRVGLFGPPSPPPK